jgi:hypothetical protein
MLEPHLAEIKHKEEPKLRHPESLACGKFLRAMLQWENRRVPVPPDMGSNPVWETFGRPRSEHQASCGILPATLGINQHSSLGRLNLRPTKNQTNKENWTINKEQKTNTQQRVQGAVSAPEKKGEARSWSPCELSVNKGWKSRRADSRLVISCCLKRGS